MWSWQLSRRPLRWEATSAVATSFYQANAFETWWIDSAQGSASGAQVVIVGSWAAESTLADYCLQQGASRNQPFELQILEQQFLPFVVYNWGILCYPDSPVRIYRVGCFKVMSSSLSGANFIKSNTKRTIFESFSASAETWIWQVWAETWRVSSVVTPKKSVSKNKGIQLGEVASLDQSSSYPVYIWSVISTSPGLFSPHPSLFQRACHSKRVLFS